MRVINSDHRYKLHSQGFKHIIEFRWHNRTDNDMFLAMKKMLEETYGPEKEFSSRDENACVEFWSLNKNWRSEQNRNAKRRRIYFANRDDTTLFLLKLS